MLCVCQASYGSQRGLCCLARREWKGPVRSLNGSLTKQLTFGHIFWFFLQLSGREFHHIGHNMGTHHHRAPKRPLFHHKDAEGRVQVDLLWELLHKNHKKNLQTGV